MLGSAAVRALPPNQDERRRYSVLPCKPSRVRLRQPAILSHLDDDLAFCTPRFEVSQSLFGGFERENPIHDLPDDASFNEGRDLAQLLAVRSHENKRIADAVALGLLPDAEA